MFLSKKKKKKKIRGINMPQTEDSLVTDLLNSFLSVDGSVHMF